MKIDRTNPVHYIILTWVGLLILLFLPLRLTRSFNRSKTVILYGHKLHGDLHALYELSLSRPKLFTDIRLYFLTMDATYHHDIYAKANILLALNPRHLLRVVLADIIVSDHGLHVPNFATQAHQDKIRRRLARYPLQRLYPRRLSGAAQICGNLGILNAFKKLYIEQFGFEQERVRVTGYGRTDLILGYHKKRESIRERLGIDRDKKVILFAPTWKQDDRSRNEVPFSLTAKEFFKRLDDFAVRQNAIFLIRFHLNTELVEHLACPNLIHLPLQKHPNGEELVAISDVLITDWSSIAFDMMVLDKPLIFLDVPAPFKNGFSLGPEFRVGDLVGDFEQLTKSLSEACYSEQNYLSRHNHEYRKVKNLVYDDTLDGKSAARYFARLQKLLEE